ncbi:MAG: hydrogenase maturation protease [Ilumatobacteraceae bacterium]
MTNGVLVVGYGSSLRTDDGLGWHAAQRLAEDPRFVGMSVLQRHQLTPELALDISAAALVILLDASSALPPGKVVVEQVDRADGAAQSWSHHLSPAALVSLSHELYGRAAEVYVVSCGAQSMDIGDRLSPVAEAALPKMLDAVEELVACHNGGGNLATEVAQLASGLPACTQFSDRKLEK